MFAITMLLDILLLLCEFTFGLIERTPGLVISVTNLSQIFLFSNYSCFICLPLLKTGSSLGMIARGAC